AHQGAGLGIQFLRHIERTRVIIHVIDMAAMEGRDPYQDFVTINKELEQYNLRLTERPMVIAANKMDMPDADENLEKFKDQLEEDIPIFPISAATGEGIRELLFKVADLLETAPEFPIITEEVEETRVVYKHEKDQKDFYITRDPDGAFVVQGEKVE